MQVQKKAIEGHHVVYDQWSNESMGSITGPSTDCSHHIVMVGVGMEEVESWKERISYGQSVLAYLAQCHVPCDP
jgi:hypothetical protein